MIDPLNVHYRTCFSTESGRIVLANMLILSGYFDPELKPEEVPVQNFMKKVLQNCSVHPKGAKDFATVGSYVQKLFEIPMRNV